MFETYRSHYKTGDISALNSRCFQGKQQRKSLFSIRFLLLFNSVSSFTFHSLELHWSGHFLSWSAFHCFKILCYSLGLVLWSQEAPLLRNSETKSHILGVTGYDNTAYTLIKTQVFGTILSHQFGTWMLPGCWTPIIYPLLCRPNTVAGECVLCVCALQVLIKANSKHLYF